MGDVLDDTRATAGSSSTDVELVAALIGGRRATNIAHALLQEAQSPWALRLWSIRRLRQAGLGPGAAARLIAAFELGGRALLPPRSHARLLGPAESFAFVAHYFVGCVRERFIAVSLDVKSRPVRVTVVAEGSSDACPVDPREVFRVAVGEGATAVIVAHNHPSGDARPSAEDLVLTERLVAAGEVVGIRVLDHIVVALTRVDPLPEDYVSLVAAGLWPRSPGSGRNEGYRRRFRSRAGACGSNGSPPIAADLFP